MNTESSYQYLRRDIIRSMANEVENCCSGVHEYIEHTAEEGRCLTEFTLK